MKRIRPCCSRCGGALSIPHLACELPKFLKQDSVHVATCTTSRTRIWNCAAGGASPLIDSRPKSATERWSSSVASALPTSTEPNLTEKHLGEPGPPDWQTYQNNSLVSQHSRAASPLLRKLNFSPSLSCTCLQTTGANNWSS